MKKTDAPTFKTFLKFFPKMDYPIDLNEDAHHTFSVENKPLPSAFIEAFIQPYEKDEADEFTEYVPCFQLPNNDIYHGIVYWRAKLMDYHYMLNTYEKDGTFIQAIHIAGLRTDGEQVAKLFCTIKDKNHIHLVAGSSSVDQTHYDASTSKAFIIQLEDDGTADIEMDETLFT